MESYVGQIILVAFQRVPNGWAVCDGSLLQIRTYQALYSLLGTKFGGDGVNTFAVPDLRGRVPLHFGAQTPSTSAYTFAQNGGVENVTLLATQMPVHNHSLQVDAKAGTTAVPQGNNLAQVENPNADTPFSSFTSGNPTTPVQLAPATVGNAGAGAPHENRQPFLALNFIIATVGLYPDFS